MWKKTVQTRGRNLALICVVGVSCAVAGTAQAAACDAPAHREFDFWIGQWEVRTPDGKLAGHNTISREYDGCVLHEKYTTPRNFSGESLNAWDAARKVWHQTWVDNTGTVLLLDGGMQGNSMVLQGNGVDANNKPVKHRITWTPNKDGTVRQHWQSTDAKGEWTTAFDGLYKRK